MCGLCRTAAAAHVGGSDGGEADYALMHRRRMEEGEMRLVNFCATIRLEGNVF